MSSGGVTPDRARSAGLFASLISPTGSPFFLLAILMALALGALHALGPGHGKTIMAAYLFGEKKARMGSAVAVGLAVSAMHTGSVLALGLITLFASRLFSPEQVYPWLGVFSGCVVVALGGALLITRYRAKRRGEDPWHGHDHDEGHGGSGENTRFRPVSRRGMAALAVSGGILPSPAALVVLLGAVALHRVAYGLALIAAFSLGLAAALVVVGLVAVRARALLSGRIGGPVALLPLASAGVILAVGVFLTARSVLQVL